MSEDFENEDGELGGASVLSASSGAPKAKRRKGKVVFIAQSELPAEYSGPTVTLARLEPVLKDGKVTSQKELQEVGVTVTLCPLTPEEELEAIERADGVDLKQRYELMKMSMRGFNGRPINRSEFEQDTIFTAIGPKGRNLIAAGFGRLSAATTEAVVKFDYFFRDEEV